MTFVLVLIAGIVAVVLNLILPKEVEDVDRHGGDTSSDFEHHHDEVFLEEQKEMSSVGKSRSSKDT